MFFYNIPREFQNIDRKNMANVYMNDFPMTC